MLAWRMRGPGTDLEARDGGVTRASPHAAELLRSRLLAAIAAGAGLVHGCGGLARDTAEGDVELETSQSGSREGDPISNGRNASPTPRRGMPQPSVPPPSMPASQPGTEPPARDGELCYSPSAIAEATGIGNLIEFLPADAFDDNGCLASQYTSWLDGGACNYDPRPAVVRGDRCCHLLDAAIPACGRPFVVGDSARVAPVRAGGAWVATLTARSRALNPELAREIGGEWLADAQLEHASVASFAAFSLSLLAVGAPAPLLEQSQRAGLDEAEHARAAFALASQFLAEAVEPGPLSLAGVQIETDLDQLALRTFLDGCVEETIAALIAAAQLDVASDEAVRAALARIAADEARHAELAWSFVAWALAIGGAPLRLRLLAARDRLEASGVGAASVTPADRAEQDLRHAHGRLDPAELRVLRASAWQEVIRPALDALLAARDERGPFTDRRSAAPRAASSARCRA